LSPPFPLGPHPSYCGDARTPARTTRAAASRLNLHSKQLFPALVSFFFDLKNLLRRRGSDAKVAPFTPCFSSSSPEDYLMLVVEDGKSNQVGATTLSLFSRGKVMGMKRRFSLPR